MSPHEHPDQDPDAKADASAFQPDFLRDVGRAVAAGFPPADDDPEWMTLDVDGQAAFDAMWAGGRL